MANSLNRLYVYKKLLQNVFLYEWTRNALECTELNVEFQNFSGGDTPDLLFMLWHTLARKVAHSHYLARDNNDLTMAWLTAKAGAATVVELNCFEYICHFIALMWFETGK